MPTQRPGQDDDDDLLLEQEDEQPLEHEEQPPEEPADDVDELEDAEPVDETPEVVEPIHKKERRKLSKEESARSKKAAERRIRDRQERYARENTLRQEAAAAKAEAAAARAELEAIKASSVESTVSRIDEQLSQAERDLEMASEAGQTKDVVRASRAIARLEAERYALASKIPPKRTDGQQQQQPHAPQQQTRQSFDGVPTNVLAWSARHGDITTWSPMESEVLWRVAEDIRDEGEIDTDSPAFLKELEVRLASQLPHRINSTVPKRGAAYDLRRPRAQPSPAVNGEGGTAPTSGPKRQLQGSERALLRQMYQGEPTASQIASYVKANPEVPQDLMRRERSR